MRAFFRRRRVISSWVCSSPSPRAQVPPFQIGGQNERRGVMVIQLGKLRLYARELAGMQSVAPVNQHAIVDDDRMRQRKPGRAPQILPAAATSGEIVPATPVFPVFRLSHPPLGLLILPWTAVSVAWRSCVGVPFGRVSSSRSCGACPGLGGALFGPTMPLVAGGSLAGKLSSSASSCLSPGCRLTLTSRLLGAPGGKSSRRTCRGPSSGECMPVLEPR
jgi:hypothetical protein